MPVTLTLIETVSSLTVSCSLAAWSLFLCREVASNFSSLTSVRTEQYTREYTAGVHCGSSIVEHLQRVKFSVVLFYTTLYDKDV